MEKRRRQRLQKGVQPFWMKCSKVTKGVTENKTFRQALRQMPQHWSLGGRLADTLVFGEMLGSTESCLGHDCATDGKLAIIAFGKHSSISLCLPTVGAAATRRGHLAVGAYACNPNIQETGPGDSQRGYPQLLQERSRGKDVS